jgi:hypothetical protein
VITRAEWDLRQSQWAEHQRWVDAQAPPEVDPEQVIADLGALLEWMPTSTQVEVVDPAKLGVQRMHFLLGRLQNR